MAEAFLRVLRPDIEIETAGTQVLPQDEGKKLQDASSGRGIAAMREVGIDMSEQTVNQLMPAMIERADRVILMGPTPGGPLPAYLESLARLENWEVPDPGYGYITHVEARDLIRAKVEALAEELPRS